jgi:hypothetical protein
VIIEDVEPFLGVVDLRFEGCGGAGFDASEFFGQD